MLDLKGYFLIGFPLDTQEHEEGGSVLICRPLREDCMPETRQLIGAPQGFEPRTNRLLDGLRALMKLDQARCSSMEKTAMWSEPSERGPRLLDGNLGRPDPHLDDRESSLTLPPVLNDSRSEL